MNKVLTFIVLVILTFIINILEVTLLSPSANNHYFPDLNLIFIIYISINKNLPLGILIVLLNGYMKDLMSGYMLGINIFSRLSLFIILTSSLDYFNFKNIMPKLMALFFGTIYIWLFLWSIIFLKSVSDFEVGANAIMKQAIINSLIGILIFQLSYKINARIQK